MFFVFGCHVKRLSLLLILFSGTQCPASSGSFFVDGILPGCQYECRTTMHLKPLEKESVSFLCTLRIFVWMCVVVKGGVRHAWMCSWCQSVWTELIRVHTACKSSPATSTLCLDNVKSTVNVLCSSGHQICVLAPLAILVMSQLILVPHGLSVLLSHLQSHFTWIITTSLSFFYTILCKQLRMAVQKFVIRCKKCYSSWIMLSSFKACLHQRNCAIV